MIDNVLSCQLETPAWQVFMLSEGF